MRNQMIEVKEQKQIATFECKCTSSKNEGTKFFPPGLRKQTTFQP